MNLDKLGRTLGVIAAVAILAMVLQGCGGDDGVSQSMHDQVVMDRDDLQGMLDTAKQRVTDLEGQLEDEQDENSDLMTQLQDAKDQRDALQKQIDDAAAEAAREMAIDVTNAQDGLIRVVPFLGGTATAPGVTASSAGEFSASQARYTMADGSPDMIDGWRGAMLERDNQLITLYSDIDDAVATPLGDLYNPTSPGAGSYFVDRTADANDDMAGDIPWASVTRDDAMSVYTADDPSTPTVDEEMTTFAGMVGNAAGTFSCADPAADCNVPARNSDGSVDDPTDAANWTFTPTDPAAMMDVSDGDGYLVLGWWLQEDDDGIPTGLDTFTSVAGMARRADDATAVTALTGVAVYRGASVGQYALHSLGAANSEAGHFTADAMLEADFDVETDTAETMDGVMVTGMIDNFMTGETSRDWTVELMMTDQDTTLDGMQGTAALPFFSTTTGGNVSSLTTEWDLGGNVKGTGFWVAQFWGSDTAAAAAANYPLAVTGEFGAFLGPVGSMTGVFGATMEE